MATAWRPTGAFLDNRKALTAECIEATGIGGNGKSLLDRWDKYSRDPAVQKPELTKAFIRAGQFCARRTPHQIVPIVESMGQFPGLDDECFVELSSLAAELGELETCKVLLNRSLGTRRAMSFYLSILQMATENAEVVDMKLAQEVSDEMNAVGIPFCFPSLRMMMNGFARCTELAPEPIFAIIKFALTSTDTPNICFLQQAMGILETFRGEDAIKAAEFTHEVFTRTHLRMMISGVIPPNYDSEPHHQGMTVTYYIVDPFTVNLDVQLAMPQNSYAMFLHSSLRSLSEKCITCATNHPLKARAELIQGLLKDQPTGTAVFPWDLELRLHADASLPAIQNGASQKLIAFVKAIRRTCSESCKLLVVSTDRAIRAELGAEGSGVEVIPQLPQVIMKQSS